MHVMRAASYGSVDPLDDVDDAPLDDVDDVPLDDVDELDGPPPPEEDDEEPPPLPPPLPPLPVPGLDEHATVVMTESPKDKSAIVR